MLRGLGGHSQENLHDMLHAYHWQIWGHAQHLRLQFSGGTLSTPTCLCSVRTEDGGLDTNLHVVAYFGVAVSCLVACAAQRHVLHDGHMVPHHCRLADHNACAHEGPS